MNAPLPCRRSEFSLTLADHHDCFAEVLVECNGHPMGSFVIDCSEESNSLHRSLTNWWQTLIRKRC